MEKEISDFNKMIGFDDESPSSSLNDPGAINPEVISQLEGIAGSANPEPPKIKSDNSNESDDLKNLEADLALPYAKEDNTDYGNLFKSTFGEENPAIKTRSDYEIEASKIYYRDEFIKQYDLTMVNEAIEGKIAKDEIIKQVTENNLRSQKLFTQRLYDEQMAQYINEGTLTADGEKRYNEIVEELKKYKSQIEKGAEEFADSKVKEISNQNTTRIEAAKAFNPFGLPMSEEWKSHIADVVTGGDLYRYINEPKDEKEAVDREMWLAIMASPKARADLFKAIYERGVKHGVAKKAKSVFS